MEMDESEKFAKHLANAFREAATGASATMLGVLSAVALSPHPLGFIMTLVAAYFAYETVNSFADGLEKPIEEKAIEKPKISMPPKRP